MIVEEGQTWRNLDSGHDYKVRSLTKGKVVRLLTLLSWVVTLGRKSARTWVRGVVYEREGQSYWRDERDFVRKFWYSPTQ